MFPRVDIVERAGAKQREEFHLRSSKLALPVDSLSPARYCCCLIRLRLSPATLLWKAQRNRMSVERTAETHLLDGE